MPCRSYEDDHVTVADDLRRKLNLVTEMLCSVMTHLQKCEDNGGLASLHTVKKNTTGLGIWWEKHQEEDRKEAERERQRKEAEKLHIKSELQNLQKKLKEYE